MPRGGGGYHYLGYIHTKGASHIRHDADPRMIRAINSWRHLMEAAVIDRWRDAVAKLDAFDIAGACYREFPWPHFSGNFWWAAQRHVKNLPHPITGPLPPSTAFDDNPVLKRRSDFERWIGINNNSAYDFYTWPMKRDGSSTTGDHDFNMMFLDVSPFYRDNMK